MVSALDGSRQVSAAHDGHGPGSFRDVLYSHLVEKGITNKLGNPNLVAFSELLDGYVYETLRKAIAGDRQPTSGLMEAVAEALDIQPTEFLEYRIWAAQRQFDPREVGMDVALQNLNAWSTAQAKSKKR